jgi:hypothetical protein
MSELNILSRLESSPNGTPKRVRKTVARPTTVRKARVKPHVRRLRMALCYAVASIALFVLMLSLWHCTEGIAELTGMPIIAALLLAIGIDAGIVLCEGVVLVGGDHAAKWAWGYVVAGCGCSMLLNSFAIVHQADTVAKAILGAMIGILIPAFVLVLAKVAGTLYTE